MFYYPHKIRTDLYFRSQSKKKLIASGRQKNFLIKLKSLMMYDLPSITSFQVVFFRDVFLNILLLFRDQVRSEIIFLFFSNKSFYTYSNYESTMLTKIVVSEIHRENMYTLFPCIFQHLYERWGLSDPGALLSAHSLIRVCNFLAVNLYNRLSCINIHLTNFFSIKIFISL